MDVNGAARIPPRIDGFERDVAVGIAYLIATKECLASGVGLARRGRFIGIFADGVGMPHIDLNARHR